MAVSKELQRMFTRYVVVSALSALINFLSRILFSLVLAYPYAVAAAYLSGMLVNFCLSTLLVFKSFDEDRLYLIFLRFTAVALTGLLITVLSSVLCCEMLLMLKLPLALGTLELISHLCGIGLTFIFSFLGHRYFTYGYPEFKSLRQGRAGE